MFIIFTGNGKGKTTAALGQALRAVGDKKTVLVVQFIKGPWKSGEDSSHKKLSPHLKIVKKGKGFVGIGDDKLPREIHMKAAHDALAYATSEAISRKWNILVLDEVWNAVDLKLLSPDVVHSFIDTAIVHLDHIIMTGRNCPKEFIERADLVTEMRQIKHPFSKGIQGTTGLEY